MCYTVITEEYKDHTGRKRPVVYNVEATNFEKLLAIIYSGIDMSGSGEKMRLINLPSRIEKKIQSESTEIHTDH